MIDCTKCNNFYYNNDGSGTCNAPYEDACHRTNNIFHTDPIKFAEEYLDIKLYPWQKLVLRWVMINNKMHTIKKRKSNFKKGME